MTIFKQRKPVDPVDYTYYSHLDFDDYGRGVVVVTPYKATYEFIRDKYLINIEHDWVQKGTLDDIFDCTVWGMLPLHLACKTRRLVVIPIIRPEHMMHEEMTYSDICDHARKPVVYTVKRVES